MGRDLFAVQPQEAIQPEATVQPKGRDLFAVQQPQGVISDDSNGSIDSPSIDNANTGSEQPLEKRVDDVLLSIPGVPSLAEFAAGTNRSVAGFLDFLGPDNVNAVLELAGAESRVPTFSENIAVPPAQFVEPGLQQKVLSTAGEIAPAALGIGQTLRTLASKLPGFATTETAKAGTLRQLGATTAKQDVVSGVAAGVGQETGRELGGEEGALVGGVLAPVALAAIPLNAARGAASKLLKQSAPSKDQIKEAARNIYKSLDDAGVSIQSKEFDSLADDVISTMRKQGFDRDTTPQIQAIIRRFGEDKGATKSLSDIDLLRQIARDAGDSLKPRERRLSSLAVNKIDDFLDSQTATVDGKEVGPAFKAARDLWQRARKVEVLESAVIDAKSQASGFENGLRAQFRAIAKKINKGKLKGFTKEEVAAIEKVNKGTNAGNVARFLGKFGVLDGVTSRSLTTLGGAGLAGSATGSPLAAIAVPGIGQVSNALAQRMTANNAAMASAIIRSGKNGASIASIYVKNTPKSARSATELAELLLSSKVPLEKVILSATKPLISDAAIIASIAKLNDTKEGEK
tara:strand:- start:1170 stop:2888 length:1719 start_codon:yes stop_codon:yes gene_type:complete